MVEGCQSCIDGHEKRRIKALTDAEFMSAYVARAREHSEYPAELDALEALAKSEDQGFIVQKNMIREALRKFRAEMEGKT